MNVVSDEKMMRDFGDSLLFEKGASDQTDENYMRDLQKLSDFLQGVESTLMKATPEIINAFFIKEILVLVALQGISLAISISISF